MCITAKHIQNCCIQSLTRYLKLKHSNINQAEQQSNSNVLTLPHRHMNQTRSTTRATLQSLLLRSTAAFFLFFFNLLGILAEFKNVVTV